MQQVIRNGAGERLDYSFTPGAEGCGREAELAVIGHGVTANKDREWALTLAQTLRLAGLSSLRFSFSGNGESEGDFREATPKKEVDDLGAVLDQCAGRKLCYVGHSMGAAVGVLRAARDRRIARLVSLGGMLDCAGFAERKFGALVPGADYMWDKPECPLSQAFMDDMAQIGSLADLAQTIEVPWLLVHGSADSVVGMEESQEIGSAHGNSTHFIAIEGGDHVFSGGAATLMANQVRDWLIQ